MASRKALISLLMVCVLLLVTSVNVFADAPVDKYKVTEETAMNELRNKTVSEIIAEMNDSTSQNSLIYLATVLQEKFDTVTDEYVVEQIQNDSNSLPVRVTLLQLSEARKELPVFKTLYSEIVDEQNGYDAILRQNALWELPKNVQTVEILKQLIENESNAVSFNAMKYLYLVSKDDAISLSKAILEENDLNNSDRFSSAVNTITRSYDDLSNKERTEFIEKCAYALEKTQNQDLIDMVAISLAKFKEEEAVKTVLDCDRIDELYKYNCFISNKDTVIRCLESKDPVLMRFIQNNPEYVSEDPVCKLALDITNIEPRMTIPANPVVGYQAYAVYCEGGWYNPDWHAGVMNRSTADHTDSVIHIRKITGPIETSSWSEFTGGTAYKGLYKAKKSFTKENATKILTTARMLTLQRISYILLRQVDFAVIYHTDTARKGTVDEIKAVRCDGVIEYSYEYNNVRVAGNDTTWDVSRLSWLNNDAHMGVNVTPEKQATISMLKVSSSKP